MSQDLPEHFEENMDKWMKNFLILLTINSKDLKLEVNNIFSIAVGHKILINLMTVELLYLILATCASQLDEVSYNQYCYYGCIISVGFLKLGMSLLL